MTPYSDRAWAYGGIPRVVAAQTEELAARGIEITVATTDALDTRSRDPGGDPRRPRRPHQATRRGGATVRAFPNLSNRLAARQQLYLPLGLGRWLAAAAGGFDVGHLHGCHNLPGVIAARRLRRAGVPWVAQPNGTAARHERRLLAKRLFDLVFGQRPLYGAAMVVAVTESERRQLERLGVAPGRIRVIPNPVRPEPAPNPDEVAAFRSRLGLGPAPVVTYLGQLSPRKRVDLAVRAVAGLGDPEVLLVVAGADMGSRPGLETLAARLGIADRTRFAGVLEGRERLAALAAADVVVYPTVDEIFGLVPMEALLAGTPVVVSGDSGCGEVVRATGGGEIVPAGDAAAVTAAVAGILAAPDSWRPPVEAAARRIGELFGPRTVGERLEALYRDVAGGRAAEEE